MGRPANTPETFWKRVDKSAGPDKCWPWMGAITKIGGYGATSINWKYTPSHRAAYIFTHGPIPDTACVCHKCDNRPCCNPAHLFLGSTQDNTKDMVRKRRQSRGESHSKAITPGRLRGARNHASKVTEEQVRQMRRIRTTTKRTVKDIAREFGLSYHGTQKILLREVWKHIN